MRAQNARIADLEAQLTRRTEPAKPQPTKEETRQKFYDDPIGATRDIIREELTATVGPLQGFVDEFRSTNRLDAVIARTRNNPEFAPQWGPRLEGYVREQIDIWIQQQRRAGNPVEVTDQVVGAIALSGIGLKSLGRIREDTPREPPPREPPPRLVTDDTTMPPVPPYMRPSGSPGPTSPAPAAPRFAPLNELELRVLREYNATKPRDKQMTEEQYRKWQSLPAAEVPRTQFDKAPPPPAGNNNPPGFPARR